MQILPKTLFAQAVPDFYLITNPTRNGKAMRYTPTECPKCGTELARSPKGGRPTRWCSDGCRNAGEAEMTRLQRLLVKFEEGQTRHLLNYAEANPRRQKVIDEMQARYDHLAGCPERTS